MPKKKETSPLSWEYELKYGDKTVCGVDEAGRGPLVGRVYAAAVIIPNELSQHPTVLALNDSKKLSEKRRFLLADEIKALGIPYCVAFSEVSEIESINILQASLLAMRRAIDGLPVRPDVALIDGNVEKGFQLEAHAIVGGDGISPSIAAASILAKTERDRYCLDYLDKTYPEYGFAAHKGYGTKAHYEALEKYGPCPEHRMSFLKKFYAK